MEKKKVLMVANNDLGIGGIQSVIMSIVRSLSADFQFDILVFDHTNTNYESEVLQQGKIFTVQNVVNGNNFRKKIDFYIRFPKNYLEIKKIIQTNGPYTAIHCHNFFESSISLLAAKQEKIPRRLVHSHSVLYVNKRKYMRRFYQYIYRKIILNTATDLLACSSLAGNYLYGKRHDVKIIPNGIDVRKFATFKGVCDNQWSFIQVGRWGTVKNQLFTIDVFFNIHKVFPQSKFTFIGGGDENYLNKIKDKVKSLNIEESVIFLPEDSNVPLIMSNNNALIFPSVFEGLGIVAIEAQALGMHCFVSDSIPKEVDLGNVSFLDLHRGAQFWATYIIDKIKKNGNERHYVNMDKFDMENVREIYRTLYGGD